MKIVATHLLSPETSNLQALQLYVNSKIGDEGLRILSNALCSSTHNKLIDINLTETGMGIEGLKEFSRYLRIRSTLKTLVISRNKKIGDEGMKIICDAIADNTSLNTLICHNSEVNLRGGLYLESLLSSYRHSSHLFTALISDSGIGKSQRNRISILSEQNKWKCEVYSLIDSALEGLPPGLNVDTVSSLLLNKKKRERYRNMLILPLLRFPSFVDHQKIDVRYKDVSDIDSIFENSVDVFKWKVGFIHIFSLLASNIQDDDYNDD